MEKFNGGACRNQFWCVIFASFVFSFSLFYFDSLSLLGSNNVLQSTNDYVHSILNLLPKPNSLLISKNGNQPIVQNPVFDNGVNQVDDQISVRVNVSNERGHVNQSDVMKNETDPVAKRPLSENKNETFDKNRVEFVDRVISIEKEPELDPCSGKYIYVHDLPSKFNSDLLKECRTLCSWMDMCHYLSNEGLGPKLDNKNGVLTDKGWFMTDQFSLDVIFHNRMKQYKCLTKNSSLASAIYVPFYAGLDAGRYLWGFNTSMRDYTSHGLIQWISNKPEWQVLGGRDHFMVAGRITWDFRRARDVDSEWGNSLMFMPESKNMTILVIESSPWHSNDFAIPYPSYFHPSKDNEVLQWQKKMRKQKKKYLFCFAGAPRPKLVDSIRDQIIEQCEASKGKCKLLECYKGTDKCNSPVDIMKMFQNSAFCLQPPGDSYTRKSAFDSILAGCIPVFFHPGSAYIQYIWHLPQNYTKYSVFLPVDDVRSGKLNIESTLSQIPGKELKAMKKEIIRLIPKLLYADPRSRLETVEDAFDLAVQGVIQRVNEIRREIKEGSKDVSYSEVNSWKSSLAGTAEEHEWEPYFSKTVS